jgi:hypothetical protein
MPPNRKHHQSPTQRTQPKGRDQDGKPYEPIEIPVPTEADVLGALEKLAKTDQKDEEKNSIPKTR